MGRLDGAPRDELGHLLPRPTPAVLRCTRCGLERDFRPRKGRLTGQPYCKGCMHAYWQAWRRRKRDAFIAERKRVILAGWR